MKLHVVLTMIAVMAMVTFAQEDTSAVASEAAELPGTTYIVDVVGTPDEEPLADAEEVVIDDGEIAEVESTPSQSPAADAPAAPAPIRIGGANRLDGIAAVVGDEIILVSELEAYVYMRLASLGVSHEDADIRKVVELCMEDLIDNKVILSRAKSDSTITVRNDEVESMLNNHINMILRQNRITMEQLELQLRIQQGTTMARFKTEARRAIREQLYKQKIQQGFFFGVSVNRRDVERFYEEYADSLPQVGESLELFKLSLRVSASDSVRQAAFDKINRIKKALDEGASFDSLARLYSEGPEAASGGDLGYLEKGSTTEIVLEERAFGQPVGRIGEPFETRLGYHIILVEERRDRRVKLRQIMVRHAPTEAERAAVVARLDSLRHVITTREAFEAAVRELSVDLTTRPRGGDMGWLGLTEIPPVVRAVVLDLEDGGISVPVAEDNVMSIYMVNKRVETRRLTLADDYAAISEMARDITAQKRMLDAVKSWRDKTFIDIRM